MAFNLQHYKNVLFYNLLFDKDTLSLNYFVCAKSIGASVSGYLGHSPDMKNETEKEIYQYARRLMNDVLVNRIEFNQLLEQMASELGINKNIIKNEVNVSDPLIKVLINDDYRQFQELVKNHKRDDSVYNCNMDIEVHDWMNNIDIFNAFLRRLKNGYSLSQTDYAYNIASFTADYLNSKTKLSLDEQEEIYHISQQLVQDLLIKQYPLELVSDYAGYNITPLTRTMIDGNYEEFKTLLDAKYNPNQRGDGFPYTPLEWALMCQPNDAQYIRELINAGADVNKENELIYGCIAESVEGVKLLIEAGADVNKIGLCGMVPLMWTKNPDIIDLLIKAGADVNKQVSSCTPLTSLCQKDVDVSIVQKLIEAGGDVNACGRGCFEKSTPLIRALWRNNIPVVELLIKSGAKCTDFFVEQLEELKDQLGTNYDKIKDLFAQAEKKNVQNKQSVLACQNNQKTDR